MNLIREETKKELKELFKSKLKDVVEILFFKADEKECKSCVYIEKLLREVCSLNEKLKYLIFDYKSEKAKSYRINTAPVILFKQKPNIRFLGIPSGYEFSVFIEDILRISRNEIDLKIETLRKIMKIKKPTHIMVFVTSACPYCPSMVKLAHMFAFINPNILAEGINALDFRKLAEEWNVMAVPKVVINKKIEIEGAYPEEVFVDYLLKAVE